MCRQFIIFGADGDRLGRTLPGVLSHFSGGNRDAAAASKRRQERRLINGRF